MKVLSLVFLGLIFSTAHAGKVECTQEPTEKWLNRETFKKQLALQYKVKKFKITEGNCYEIYGYNKQDQKIEIYFNPVDGHIVKSRIE